MFSGTIEGIKKELLFVMSRRTTLFLVIFFPLLTIMTFGSIYSTTLSQSVSMAIFIDEGANFVEQSATNPLGYKVDFLQEIAKSPNIRIIEANSEDEARQKVLQNEVDGGIVISKPSSREPYRVNIILDNTDFVQAAVIRSTAAYTIDSLSNRISVAIIQKIWEKMVSQEWKMHEQLERVDSFLIEFGKTKEMTSEIEQRAGSINVGEIRQIIADQNRGLANMRSQLVQSRASIDSQHKLLQDFKSTFTNSLYMNGLKYTDANGNLRYTLGAQSMEMIVDSYIFNLSSNVSAQKSTYDDAIAKMDSAIATMGKLDRELSDSQEYVSSFKTFIADAKKLQTSIERDIRESRAMLADALETIRGIKEYSPEFLAKPATISYTDSVKISNLSTEFFPTVIALVAMFTGVLLTAISLISEKRQNVMARLRTMPVSRAGLIVQKVIGSLAVLFVVQLVLLGAGIVGFGIQLNGGIMGTLVSTMLISLCFITLGLLIGSLTSNEPSAILATLVLALPLIFLSGLFVPIELMPSGIQMLKYLNPLSAGSVLATNTLIKGLSLFYSIKEIVCLLATSAVSLLVAYIKYF
ncbi:MAG TPA: ABC transporter permease [Candidatus Diapherotrites archaeon]|uniref:ABC transporter permease n=1 Tax=Candidatus Iainarchaeum sp. TaxID=3101447 RepID=A0A7J4IWX4_9ARCH|nr:ABC transporter permease [Candidatus Diapherotrites archaeon]